MSSKIVIIGAGFAGMWAAIGAARKLDEAGKTNGDIEIILIAPEPVLHVCPRFYESDVSGAVASLTELLTTVGIRYIQGTVERIAVEKDQVGYVASDGSASTIHYDRLVLASGSKLFHPAAVAGLSEYTFNTDQITDAHKLDLHLKSLAALPDSPARNTVVVCGGGFTGLEVAAEMPSRLREILGQDVDVKVVIVERGDNVGLGPGPRPVITKALTSLGVTVLAGQNVASISADGITTASGEHIPSKTVIWTAGLRASALTEQIPGTKDSLGRLHVTGDLKVVGLEKVFATGDTAYALTDDEGHYALMSCQHAMQLGKISGHNVAADLLEHPMQPYRQPIYGTCLDLGPWGAVVTDGWDRKVVAEGAEAKKIKNYINTRLIYPPAANRVEAFAQADPFNPITVPA